MGVWKNISEKLFPSLKEQSDTHAPTGGVGRKSAGPLPSSRLPQAFVASRSCSGMLLVTPFDEFDEAFEFYRKLGADGVSPVAVYRVFSESWRECV